MRAKIMILHIDIIGSTPTQKMKQFEVLHERTFLSLVFFPFPIFFTNYLSIKLPIY